MGKHVEFKTKEGICDGYLSHPSNGGIGLLVLQEWWGLNENIKNICDHFSQKGYTCLAPNLFHKDSTDKPSEAEREMMALNIHQASQDLVAATAYLLSLDVCLSKKVAVMGFCMGGQLALYSASMDKNIGACVDFYGVHPKVQVNYSQIDCPVLAFFGEKDEFIPRENIDNIQKELKKANVDLECHLYPQAGHAFFNQSRPEAFNKEAAEDAEKKVDAFIKKAIPHS